MNTALKVFNFGPTSFRDANNFRHAGQLLQNIHPQPLIIFASAIEGMTPILERIIDAHQKGDITDAMNLLDSVRKKHTEIAKELLGTKHSIHDELNDHLVTIEWDLEDPPHDNIDFAYDQIIAIGSLLSTQLLAAYLNELKLPTHWIDARDIVLADDTFRNGQINSVETKLRVQKNIQPLLKQDRFILSQAGLGTTTENYSITLSPEEGSAYSAASIADYLDAEELYIWTKPLTEHANLSENVIRFDHKE